MVGVNIGETTGTGLTLVGAAAEFGDGELWHENVGFCDLDGRSKEFIHEKIKGPHRVGV